jgi:hypothetical protein
MAAGQISKPGSRYGPCVECSHIDCAKSRDMAQTICGICSEPIGYETGFYIDEGNLVHAYCFEDKYLT